MDRRTFLGTITAAMLVSNRLGWAAAGERKLDKIGVQLYSVRDEMKRDFEGTLAKVSEIGYREVEFAGFFNHTPQEVRAILDRHGLAAPSSHVDYQLLSTDWPKTLEAAHVVGQAFVVCPSVDEQLRRQPDGWKQAAETFNRAGEASQKAGIQFAYHNHDFEFKAEKGKLPYDILLAETDPKLVKMEMDLFWITKGGQEPVTYFNRYPGRFPLVHVKDMKKDGEMTEVGSGAIDFKRIFAQSDRAGIQHYFVEHDEPKSPLDSIRTSFEYLQQLRF
ncbi:MAG TPA: sugar phosphate isomerase/epimerase [Terriglobales bacterium]|nr:sugar phosphate isomerase/epimerase [Terriglobales bacterium]